MNRPILFTVIDDHSLVREGISSLITAGIPDSEIRLYSRIPPLTEVLTPPLADIIICDYRVGDSNALDFLISLSTHAAAPSVLIISMLDELEVGPPCIRAGAKGFVSKSAPSVEILTAIHLILAGKTYMSNHLTRLLMTSVDQDKSAGPLSPTRRLTQRELQIFSILGEGLSVSTVAERYGISVKTVEAHRENIKNKLSLNSAADVVIAASRWLATGS